MRKYHLASDEYPDRPACSAPGGLKYLVAPIDEFAALSSTVRCLTCHKIYIQRLEGQIDRIIHRVNMLLGMMESADAGPEAVEAHLDALAYWLTMLRGIEYPKMRHLVIRPQCVQWRRRARQWPEVRELIDVARG